ITALMTEQTMRAMVLNTQNKQVEARKIPMPEFFSHQVLVRIKACGVCRTDLHIVDGELTQSKQALIPGHEIVGEVVAAGSEVNGIKTGETVGVGWLGKTCGRCSYCIEGRENLCDEPLFTGYTHDGGYAEYAVVDADYCYRLPAFSDP